MSLTDKEIDAWLWIVVFVGWTCLFVRIVWSLLK
jgi:hypothetical protein